MKNLPAARFNIQMVSMKLARNELDVESSCLQIIEFWMWLLEMDVDF